MSFGDIHEKFISCPLFIFTYNSIFFNFQNLTYIQNEGFPATVLGTGTVVATTRAFTVQGGASKYYLENGRITFFTQEL